MILIFLKLDLLLIYMFYIHVVFFFFMFILYKNLNKTINILDSIIFDNIYVTFYSQWKTSHREW